jgi:hypothetical protein
MQMHSNLKRLALVAAVGAIGILAPVAGASAASTPTQASLASAFAPDLLDFIGPTVWPGAFGVVGPTVYTVGAGNVFIGTTITTTAGGAIVATGTGG